MAPILTITIDLWSTRGYRRNIRPDQAGKQQFTLMILSDMQLNGGRRLLPASRTKMRAFAPLGWAISLAFGPRSAAPR